MPPLSRVNTTIIITKTKQLLRHLSTYSCHRKESHCDDAPPTQKGSRGKPEQLAKQGPKLEGLKEPNTFPQSKAPPQTTKTQTFMLEHRNRKQGSKNFEVDKAGWRGPWAAPPSSEELSQETLIPRGLAAPPSRVRSWNASVSTQESE